MKCPYRECTFEGTPDEVDEHVTYCIGIEDPDHAEEE